MSATLPASASSIQDWPSIHITQLTLLNKARKVESARVCLAYTIGVGNSTCICTGPGLHGRLLNKARECKSVPSSLYNKRQPVSTCNVRLDLSCLLALRCLHLTSPHLLICSSSSDILDLCLSPSSSPSMHSDSKYIRITLDHLHRTAQSIHFFT